MLGMLFNTKKIGNMSGLVCKTKSLHFICVKKTCMPDDFQYFFPLLERMYFFLIALNIRTPAFFQQKPDSYRNGGEQLHGLSLWNERCIGHLLIFTTLIGSLRWSIQQHSNVWTYCSENLKLSIASI